jgi:hypothetical protein
VKYLFDNDNSYRFAAMLRGLGVEAYGLREKFDQRIKDPDLLAQLRGQGFVLISCDQSQTTRPSEAAVLHSAKITALYIAPFFCELRFWDQAAWIVKNWPLIDGFASGAAKGTIAEVKQNGTSAPLRF